MNSYLHSEKAIEEFEKLNRELRCINCIIPNDLCPTSCGDTICGSNECLLNCKKYAEEVCEEADIYISEDGKLLCRNLIDFNTSKFYDFPSYYIEEVDVIE